MEQTKRIADGSSSDYEIVRAGAKMSASEARLCEKALKRDPLDLITRLKLIGYYERPQRFRQQYYRHLCWYVENHPTHFVHRWLNVDKDNSHYEPVKQAWILAVRRNPVCVEILYNAASFFTLTDPALSERYLRRGQKLEPGRVDWPLELSHLYSLMCNKGSLSKRRNLARKSFEFAYRAIYLHRRFKRQSYLSVYEGMVLADLATLALSLGLNSDAKLISKKLMDIHIARLSSHDQKPDKYCAMSYGKHTARAIRGRIHLSNSNLVQAEAYLSKMAAEPIPFGSTGGPRPDMVLANQLLHVGRRECVLKYLGHCKKCCLYQLNRFNKNPKSVSFLMKKFVEKHVQKQVPLQVALLPFTSELEGAIQRLDEWIRAVENGKDPELRNIG